ncbi:DUF6215 domain-containing protein [Kitasatospora sp. NBC_01302]|uniref:DUF6215 domain-containing protein n=1 Tax=Kitasatospora sp. NBC_01302 TaxID=2903575 RepID=UPI002E0F4EAF|nr:DUF6215 domain-containing protein [Kitasatospora sp. NBC_01302]
MTDQQGTGLSAEPGSEPGKEPDIRVGAQVVAALAMGGVLVAGLLVLQHRQDAAGKPAAAATCQAATADDSPRYPALCAALNRPDLPVLVGAPTDRVTVAGPGPTHWTSSDGTKEVVHGAEVQIGQISLRLTDDDDLDVTDAEIMGTAAHHRAQVLGHLSTTYEMNTFGFSFSLGGGPASSEPGGVAHNLVIGKHPDGHGGSYELAIWRQDAGTPDEASLYRIAEAVLPSLPGWDTGTTAPSAPPATPSPAAETVQ